jgi:hypothetical protein
LLAGWLDEEVKNRSLIFCNLSGVRAGLLDRGFLRFDPEARSGCRRLVPL